MHEDALRHICRQVLDEFASSCPGLIDAAVYTRDGVEVARLGASDRKTGVMGGTMLALAEAMGRESGRGICHSVSIEGEAGNVVITPVHTEPAKHLMLAGVGGPHTSLGLLLVQCKYSSRMIGRLWHGADAHA